MASAWGRSWGASFGVAWGGLAEITTPVRLQFMGGGSPDTQIGLKDFLSRKKKRKTTHAIDPAVTALKTRQRQEDDLLVLGVL